jgi:polysaccharide export outer membrane protein
MISTKDPELTAPFNMGVGGYQVGSDGEVRRVATTAMQEGGYLVDRLGNIEYPVLGTLRVEGLTKQELAYQIKNRLKDARIISDALVTVDILNFKINVIGEVNSPGIQTVVDEKITLFEAVTRAGGVTTNAMMDKIWVMREDKRGQRLYISDLSTVNVFDSPTYYLQQNDVVYVLPKTARMTERENRTWQWINSVLGLGSIAISVMILYNYYK